MRTPILAALLAALPAAAAAQEAPARPDAQIVVTGTRTTDDEIADFVGAFTVAPPGSRQLSRFEWAVCPMASGLTPAQKQTVADRIRGVARAAGIRVDKPGCQVNVLVIVTPNKKALIEALERLHPDYFGEMGRAERRALAESPGPVAVWHLEGPPLNAEGRELHHDFGTGYYVNRTMQPASRLGFASRPQFAAAIAVIESSALEGLTATQLADYAAMRTLIRTEPALLDGSAAPTILKVLDAPMGSEVPLTLTHWDLGVLRALYASDPNLSAASQRSDMRKRVKRDVERGE